MYGSRALLMDGTAAPKTSGLSYLRRGLGLTRLATVPRRPPSGKLFGIKYLSTLFGLTLLSHQVGGFLGAYLGGIAPRKPVIIIGCGTPTWRWRLPLRCQSADTRGAAIGLRRPPERLRRLECWLGNRRWTDWLCRV
jgi:hypothetical protein